VARPAAAVVLLLLATAVAEPPAAAVAARPPRAVLVSLDGLGAEIADDAIARGVMPRLAALRARGARARATSALPTKTAPGHAALYTGAWSDRSGISGNRVPVPGGSILQTQSGFSATPLAAEPIWAAAARQGRRAVVVSATHTFPFSIYTAGLRFRGSARRLTLFDGYEGIDFPDRVVAAPAAWAAPAGLRSALPEHRGAVRATSFEIASARVDAWAFDDPADPADGLDTVLVGRERDPASGVRLKPSPPQDDADAFAPLVVRIGGSNAVVFFRLHELAADGGRMTLWHSAPHVYRSSRPPLDAAALRASGGFAGNGAGDAYDDGRLGQRLWEGGDGTAEARYVESAALVARQFSRLDEFAFARTQWDLLVTYLPYPDEALHRWYGRLDPSLPGHDPEVARRLRPYLDRVLGVVDAYIGTLEDNAGPDAVLVVASDHGMGTAARTFRPNVALARAGLLALDASGRVDLSRTRAAYFAGNTGHVRVNRAALPGGIVAPADEAAVRAEVKAALSAVTDPQTGRPLGVRVFDLHDPRPGESPSRGAVAAGDLFIELAAPAMAISASTSGAVLGPMDPEGAHYQDPESPRLLGALAFAGPGIPAGVDLGVVRQIDVAPSLAALMEIEPPRDAEGKAIPGLLQRTSPTK
jgi:predicted AlkP superfamily phosphohydrolase/phosphomutase